MKAEIKNARIIIRMSAESYNIKKSWRCKKIYKKPGQLILFASINCPGLISP